MLTLLHHFFCHQHIIVTQLIKLENKTQIQTIKIMHLLNSHCKAQKEKRKKQNRKVDFIMQGKRQVKLNQVTRLWPQIKKPKSIKKLSLSCSLFDLVGRGE